MFFPSLSFLFFSTMFSISSVEAGLQSQLSNQGSLHHHHNRAASPNFQIFSIDSNSTLQKLQEDSNNIQSRSEILEKRAKNNVPTDGIDDDEEGMKQSGYYHTTLDVKGSTFKWHYKDFAFGEKFSGNSGVDLIIDTTKVYQKIDGYGTAITDSSAYNLLGLKAGNYDLYKKVMDFLFNSRTGMGMVRVPLGSSDFSLEAYSYQETAESKFSISKASNITSILKAAKSRNPCLKIMLSPWSAPAWQKNTNNLRGGQLEDDKEDDFAEYFLNTAKAYDEINLRPFAFSIVNEPFLSSNWFPSMSMTPKKQSNVATKLRAKLNSNNFTDVKIIVHDHNFARIDEAIEAVKANPDAVSGASFHSYRGKPEDIKPFRSKTNNKNIWFTESSANGGDGTGGWTVLYWWLNSLFFPAATLHSRSVLLWNTALDKDYGPHLEKVFCENCVGSIVTSSDSVSFEPQTWVISHFSAASSSLTTIGGGVARRVGLTFPGPSASANPAWLGCIKAESFAAPYGSKKLSSNQEKKIGLVLSNVCDSKIQIKMSLDGRRTDYEVLPGLTTLQFSMKT